jgi:hypothetical protein
LAGLHESHSVRVAERSADGLPVNLPDEIEDAGARFLIHHDRQPAAVVIPPRASPGFVGAYGPFEDRFSRRLDARFSE